MDPMGLESLDHPRRYAGRARVNFRLGTYMGPSSSPRVPRPEFDPIAVLIRTS